jgi:formylglycine-generating enzyme required for sulfatase activity
VQFGGSQATSVSVVSPTQLVVVAPPGEIGSAVSLTVTTLSGVASLPEAFSYIAISVPAWATLLDPAPDPTIVTNEEIRDAIVGTRHAWRVRDNTTQAEMVLIPPGSFSMGCSASKAWDCGSEETPVHAVSLTNAFYLSRHEVTQAQWQATMGSNPSGFQGHPDSQHRPVERVSWDMIQGYLSMTGTRLPTEAEWEYAYRAGTTTAFHGFAGHPNGTNDESLVESIGWSVSNASSRTHPVGGKAPNGFGLFDMSGNVQEWVSDWFSADYYLTSSLTNPTGPASGQYRVLRGGHWGNGLGALRSSWRNWDWPHTEVSMYGFRIARNP